MNQDINITGERNRVTVMGKGRLHIGASHITVMGEDNRVIIAAGDSLTIDGQHRPKPPIVRRGQVWAHNILSRHYQVISVRGDTARCLVTDVTGEPITDGDGKATIQDLSTINLRYGYKLVRG